MSAATRWRRRAAIGLAWLGTLLAPPALADCPPLASPPDAATLSRWQAQAPDRGLLWRYERDGRGGWLFGTIHVGRAGWQLPGPQLRQAMAAADRLVLEIDPLDPATGSGLQQAAATRPEAALPEALRQRLERQLDQACLRAALSGLSPTMQAMTLLALAGRQVGLDPAWGQEPALSAAFHQAGRPVLALETPAEQVAALQGPAGQDEATLGDALSDLEQPGTVQTLLRLAHAWEAGDLDTLSHYGDWCDCLDTAERRAFYGQLIEGRNGPMLRQVLALHARGAQPLVAVGALHLVGPQGLVAQLTAAGFRLTRVGPRRPDATPAGR